MRPLAYAAAAALALALAGCSEDAPTADPAPSPTPSTAQGTPDPTGTPGGTPDGTEPLAWRPIPGPVGDTVTRNAAWTLTVTDRGRGWALDGPAGSSGSGSSRWRVSDTLLDEGWAVVVLADPSETRPTRATVTDLASGETFTLDGSTQVPTTTGGAWALGGGRLLHATYGPGRAYCLASVDLATQESEIGWCAPKRQGFNGVRVGPGGTSLMSFDSGRISCRTLLRVEGTEATPIEGPAECRAWDGLLLDQGQVWSEIPNERRIEDAHFYAIADGEEADLGPGSAGSLVWCGGAAYFTRDPQREGDPAALMRWTPAEGLGVVYESPGGRAFLSEPRCGGDALTVTALAEDGDEQVTADLG